LGSRRAGAAQTVEHLRALGQVVLDLVGQRLPARLVLAGDGPEGDDRVVDLVAKSIHRGGHILIPAIVDQSDDLLDALLHQGDLKLGAGPWIECGGDLELLDDGLHGVEQVAGQHGFGGASRSRVDGQAEHQHGDGRGLGEGERGLRA
jgi:hypothetical protein